MIAGFYGLDIDLATMRRRYSISLRGTTLKSLMNIGDELGLMSRPLQAALDELQDVQCPAILHWDLNHFVVLKAIRRRFSRQYYLISDPALGERSLTKREISRSYTGIALEMSPSHNFRTGRQKSPFNLSQMWSSIRGLKRALFQIFLLSLLMQLLAFAEPFYVQIAVDQVVPSFDKAFLSALAVGFLGVSASYLFTRTLREIALMKLGNAISLQLVSNIFRQMLRLPMSYFEKRHTGDVISRFESTQPVTDLLTHGFIAALIDGLMSLAAITLMFFYSPFLTGLAVTSVLIYILSRIIWFSSLQMANVSAITARASETSTMIETVRGMAAIKLFAGESDRHRLWQKKRGAVVNSNIVMTRIQICFDLVNSGVAALENILFIYFAVDMVIDARFTVGMIFAFQAYKQQFLGAANRLIAQWVQYRLIDTHLLRISDIALAPVEVAGYAAKTGQGADLKGELELINIHFTYGVGEDFVLKGANLKIHCGETVALVGASGGGKTTLLKLILGFHLPSSGEIRIDGEKLLHYGLQRYRKQIGAVLQEDILYAGSLSENISFFDLEISMKRVIEVAKIACIHDDIMKFPMGYETLVGDMGAAISIGQKQRVLLARALYKSPKILFLDEGTAHLDIQTEAAVNHSISKLGITRFIIAHRPETIRMADRIIALVDGKLVEMAK